MKLALILTVLSIALVSQAEEKKHVKAPHCQSIVKACKDAGFISGDWKNGDGLWVHCMNPILGRAATPKAPAAKTGLTLPTIASTEVEACLSENPNIGITKKK